MDDVADGRSQPQNLEKGTLSICVDLEDDLPAETLATNLHDGANESSMPGMARRPLSPYPGDMMPPPPSGEPPQLLSNKRPHGLAAPGTAPVVAHHTGDIWNGDGMSSDFQSCADAQMASTGECNPSKLVDDEAVPWLDSNCTPSSCHDPAFSTVDLFQEEQWEGEDEDEDEEDEGEETEVRNDQQWSVAPPEQPPGLPVGPPPAEMAPPPPFGPPPSLPLDRAELKRAVEDAAQTPLVKRLRHLPDPAENHLQVEPEASSDGDSSESTSSAGEAVLLGTLPGCPNIASSGLLAGICVPSATCGRFDKKHIAGDSSYEESPPSARWVWDRLLQQEGGHEAMAHIERRTLLALHKLDVGTVCHVEHKRPGPSLVIPGHAN